MKASSFKRHLKENRYSYVVSLAIAILGALFGALYTTGGWVSIWKYLVELISSLPSSLPVPIGLFVIIGLFALLGLFTSIKAVLSNLRPFKKRGGMFKGYLQKPILGLLWEETEFGWINPICPQCCGDLSEESEYIGSLGGGYSRDRRSLECKVCDFSMPLKESVDSMRDQARSFVMGRIRTKERKKNKRILAFK